MSSSLNKNVPKKLIDKVRYSSPAMYTIARMMPARETLTPGFRDVLGVDKAISERIKKGEYNDLFISAVEQGLVGVVKYLLNLGVDTEIKYGEVVYDVGTALHYAAYEGHTEIVKLLLDAGADKDVMVFLAQTPLHWALMEGHTEIVKLLLDVGARAHGIGGYETPLHVAARDGHTEIVKLLLDAGADVDVDVYDDNWCTPLEYAESEGHSAIVSLIKTHKPS
tara:strand:+ start:359 stop:1027 length:669 start_codon:yes stop_codon:yes gene_type:complete